jgi:hypothetical protein
VYEVLITHDGYTDTAYALCGDEQCATVVLESIGVQPDVLAGLDSNDPGVLDLGDKTTVEVGILGESDSCEWCATCGTFIRHGLVYEGEDIGCTHDQDGPDPEPREGPHIDLGDAVPMKEYWGTIFNT